MDEDVLPGSSSSEPINSSNNELNEFTPKQTNSKEQGTLFNNLTIQKYR